MLKREEVALKIFCAFGQLRRIEGHEPSEFEIRGLVKEAYRLAEIFLEETAKG